MRALEKGSLLALNGLVEPIGEGDGDGGMREGDAGVDVWVVGEEEMAGSVLGVLAGPFEDEVFV